MHAPFYSEGLVVLQILFEFHFFSAMQMQSTLYCTVSGAVVRVFYQNKIKRLPSHL